jgi:hypothetical protein
MLSLNLRRLWASSGALAVVLFGCGLLFGDLLGSSNYPPLNASYARLRAYFLHSASEVRALAFFHALSALALLCFFAYLANRLRTDGGRSRSLSGLALAGGATAAAFLLFSALAYRTLAEPTVMDDAALAHALVVISYLTGGPAIAAPLALPIIAASLLALRGALLPRWTGWLGLCAAALGLASTGTLLGPTNNSTALYGVLLLAAILAFIWLLAASALLTGRVS